MLNVFARILVGALSDQPNHGLGHSELFEHGHHFLLDALEHIPLRHQPTEARLSRVQNIVQI